MFFIYLHGICFTLCWAIWVAHALALIFFDPNRHAIVPSIWRKLFALIIYCLSFTVPEVALYLSYVFLTNDISEVRQYTDKRRKLDN
jgi:hypothetical protein